MAVAIKVEGLSKAYQLGEIGTGTISRDLERWIAKVRGKEDPFLKIGETNDRTSKGGSDVVWSLKDVNFDIEQGDAVGIIGRNGAGKSTLLKILSRVTSPTTGNIKLKGRIASLLEVGTGFHPELTGRENVFLNGAILGMRKKEIKRKFDDIVDFAGVERYIDTPVKRYSSGMYVRLAFAVAAYLDSEILIVDEVLSVGDAEFQKKCLGKMDDVSKGEGKTILFVSHNMPSILQLCKTGLVLNNGKTAFLGTAEEGIKFYIDSNKKNVNNNDLIFIPGNTEDEDVVIHSFKILPHYEGTNNFNSDKPIKVEIDFEVKRDIAGLRIGFDLIYSNDEQTLFRTFHDDVEGSVSNVKPGRYLARTEIYENLLKAEEFEISPSIGIHNNRWILRDNFRFKIKVLNLKGINSNYSDSRPGYISPKFLWNINKV